MDLSIIVAALITLAVILFAIGVRRAAPAPTAEPVVSADEANKLCCACKFFELDAAQQAIQLNPAFVRMTTTMTPYQAARKVKHVDVGPCPDCDPALNESCKTCSGDRRLIKPIDTYPDPSVLSPRAKWSEYGWCTNPNVVYDHNAQPNERIMWGGAANCEGKLFAPLVALRAKARA